MDGANRTRERLVALFVLGVVLLLPPALLVFNRPVRVLGIPALYLYIFAVWVLIIALAAAVAARISPADEPGSSSGDAERVAGEGANDA